MHTRRQVLVAALSAAATACGPRAVQREAPGVHDLEDRIHGKWRRSQLVIPEGLDPFSHPPLVMALHDTGGSHTTMMERCGWRAVCEARGWVGVFPDYIRQDAQADNAFLGHLIMRAAAIGGVDQARMSVVGHGAGGRRAYALACKHAGVITAIGAVGAPVRFHEDPGYQDPVGPSVSVIHLHGGRDTEVPVAGNDTITPLDAGLRPWIDEIDGVEAAVEREMPPGLQARRWIGHGREVVQIVDPSQDHSWNPGYGTKLIAEFFAAAPPRSV